jgi:hypothetical protein
MLVRAKACIFLLSWNIENNDLGLYEPNTGSAVRLEEL